jgi:hypothetical protein
MIIEHILLDGVIQNSDEDGNPVLPDAPCNHREMTSPRGDKRWMLLTSSSHTAHEARNAHHVERR